jgi:hypothetical protein
LKKTGVLFIIILLLCSSFVFAGFLDKITGHAFSFNKISFNKIFGQSKNKQQYFKQDLDKSNLERYKFKPPECGDGICSDSETPKGCPQDCDLDMANCNVVYDIPPVKYDNNGKMTYVPNGDDVCKQTNTYCVHALNKIANTGLNDQQTSWVMLSCDKRKLYGNYEISVLCCPKA